MKLRPERLIRQLLLSARMAVGILASCIILTTASSVAADLVSQSDAKDCPLNERGRLYENLPAPYSPTTSTEIVHTRIGGRDFYVPRNYFRHPQMGCGVEETGMLLRVLLPNLKPYSKETEDEYAAQRGIGRMIYILLTSHPPIRPLDELVGIHLEGRTADPPSKATLSLFHGRHRDGDDVYFSRSDDHVVRLIRCNPIKPNRGTICEHRFRYKGHDVTLDYGREYLPDWRLTESSVEQLLTSFTKSPQK